MNARQEPDPPEPEEVLDPSSTVGPFVAVEDQPADETTHLLSPKSPESNPLSEESKVHYRDIDGKRFWWLFSSIIFGYILCFFDSTLMVSCHPIITSYFNASNAASWLSTVFYLTSTVFQPLYGRISDTIGRRPTYLFAIGVFLVTTVWCALAQDIFSFILARAACGLGAGGVSAMGAILMSDVVKLEYRGVYQSYLNMAYGFGNGLGAALGGFICDRLGWRAAFGVQLPFILVYIILAFISVPDGLGPNLVKAQGKSTFGAFTTFDFAGAAVLTVAVTALILGINLGGNILSWTHPLVISSLVLFLVAAVVLVLVERKAVRPMLPLPLLSTIPIANLMWSNFFGMMVVNTVLFNVPLFLQVVRQTTATTAGLYLVSPLIGISISSVFSGFYITWTRRMKAMMVVGVFALLVGIIACNFLSPALPTWAVLLMNPWASIGQGFLFPATTISVLALNPQDEQAVVTTTLGLLRNLGAIMGVAVSSWVLQNALIVYLDRYVSGDESVKREIISHVRRSVTAIPNLGAKHQAEAILAYAKALRVTFASGIVFAVMVMLLVLPIHAPRLPRSTEARRSSLASHESEGD